jgi:hypothetical protein
MKFTEGKPESAFLELLTNDVFPSGLLVQVRP